MIISSIVMAIHFPNRTLVILDSVSTESIVLRQYLSHGNNSSSLSLDGISPIAPKPATVELQLRTKFCNLPLQQGSFPNNLKIELIFSAQIGEFDHFGIANS